MISDILLLNLLTIFWSSESLYRLWGHDFHAGELPSQPHPYTKEGQISNKLSENKGNKSHEINRSNRSKASYSKKML